MDFLVQQADRETSARLGRLSTAHGEIDTPAFMPVGTLGPVKGIDPVDLEQLGFRLMLNNAYHLYLRPGHKIVAEMGGLHRFTGWPGAILTDSGGFQIFSLAKLCKVTDEGVSFQSHLDGSTHFITPETAIEIEEALGADIMMAFDHCVALPADRAIVRDAVRRTTLWAQRCQASRRRRDQALFGIVQGGLDADLRVTSARDLVRAWVRGLRGRRALSGRIEARDVRHVGCDGARAAGFETAVFDGCRDARGSHRRRGTRDRSVRLCGAFSPWADGLAFYKFRASGD